MECNVHIVDYDKHLMTHFIRFMGALNNDCNKDGNSLLEYME